jgi:hypothetical protein
VFDYYHFFGSKDWIAVSPSWYRQEVRIIRNTVRSWCPDALFFLLMNKNKKGSYPKAALINVPIYHYGHVRNIAAMKKKVGRIGRYWNKKNPIFNSYKIDPKAVKLFKGTHPVIVRKWLEENAEKIFAPQSNYILSNREKKHRILMWIEKLLKRDLTKKHYEL